MNREDECNANTKALVYLDGVYSVAASEEEQKGIETLTCMTETSRQILCFPVCGLHTVCLVTSLIDMQATIVSQLHRLV